ncbi:MAG: hypothetical protein GX650_01855, partial [Clostridiales bacterium]|nr:hypothetical protein [Clostridiales bacterium]
IFGGALCLMFQVWVVYARLYSRHGHNLSRGFKTQGILLFIAALALNALLVIVYPAVLGRSGFLPLVGLVVLFLLQTFATDFTARNMATGRLLRALALIPIHLAFGALQLWPLSVLLAPDTFQVYLWLLAAFTALTVLLQVLASPLGKQASGPSEPVSPPQGTSFKLYNTMTSNAFIALNISLLCYACYIRFQPAIGPVMGLLSLLGWVVIIAAAGYLGYCFLRNNRLGKRDKPSVFGTGAFLWIGTTFLVYNGLLPQGTVGTLVANGLWGVALGLMLAVIVSIGSDMQKVIQLGLAPADAEAYQRNTAVMVDWSALLSSLLMLLIFTVSSFVIDGQLDRVDELVGMKDFMFTAMLLLPLVFVLLALISALRQPMDSHLLKQLALYERIKDLGEAAAPLKKRLEELLLHTRKIISFRLLRLILHPFFPCRVVARATVAEEDMPVIFVCNHMEVYGPVISTLYLPYYARPWIIANIIEPERVREQLRPGVERIFKFLPPAVRKFLLGIFSPLLAHILQGADPIPVYRGGGKNILKTFQVTVETMEAMENVLVFPEMPVAEDGAYDSEGVGAFYTGFCAIAERYYRRTGRCTSFIPLYANPRKRTLNIGQGMRYDPDNPKTEERERIIQYLHEWMQAEEAAQ